MKETSVRTRVLVAALAAFGFGCASSGGEATIDGAQVTVRELLTLDAFDAYVAFSPDGRTLATGIRGENPAPPGELKLWDVATGELLATMRGHSSGIIAVAFSPDGRTVATGGLDNTVRVWDVASAALRGTLRGHRSEVVEIVFSPDGRTLASSAAFPSRGATLRDSDEIRLWDVETGQERGVLQFENLDRTDIYALAFSPDGRGLVTGSSHTDRDSGEITGRVTMWDLATGEWEPIHRDRLGAILAVAFSPDGNTLASGGVSRIPRLWDVASGDRLHQLPRQRDWVYALAFSPDGEILVTGAGNTRARARTSPGTLTLWDAASGTMITTIDTDNHGVTSVAFSPDGRQLAVGIFEGNTKVFGITSAELGADPRGF